jgi:methionine aminotransferase
MTVMKLCSTMQCTTVRVSANDDYTPIGLLSKKSLFRILQNMIINNPHNPTGKILTQPILMPLNPYYKKFSKIIVLSDEVYEYITLKKNIFRHTPASIS